MIVVFVVMKVTSISRFGGSLVKSSLFNTSILIHNKDSVTSERQRSKSYL